MIMDGRGNLPVLANQGRCDLPGLKDDMPPRNSSTSATARRCSGRSCSTRRTIGAKDGLKAAESCEYSSLDPGAQYPMWPRRTFQNTILLICERPPILSCIPNKQLGKAYAIEDRGTIDGGSLLGMQVSRNWEEWTISINQQPYIQQLVERFGLIDSAPLRAATPMEKGLQLSTHKGQPTSAPYLPNPLLTRSTLTFEYPDLSCARCGVGS
jgi:hypothetical protein